MISDFSPVSQWTKKSLDSIAHPPNYILWKKQWSQGWLGFMEIYVHPKCIGGAFLLNLQCQSWRSVNSVWPKSVIVQNLVLSWLWSWRLIKCHIIWYIQWQSQVLDIGWQSYIPFCVEVFFWKEICLMVAFSDSLYPLYKIVLDYLRYWCLWYNWLIRNELSFHSLHGISQQLCRLKVHWSSSFHIYGHHFLRGFAFILVSHDFPCHMILDIVTREKNGILYCYVVLIYRLFLLERERERSF